MSHFTVTVALPGTLTEDQIEDALAVALAPFDENTVVKRYVKATRAELIVEGRNEIAQVRDNQYAEYLADPDAYAADCLNIRHLEYMAGGTEAVRERGGEVAAQWSVLRARLDERNNDPVARLIEDTNYEPMPYEQSFPAKLEWTDEQVHADQLRYYEPENIGADGEVYSTYNPKSKWDWYSIGGRWGGYWKVHEKATATKHMTEESAFGMADNAAAPDRTDVARRMDIDFTAPTDGDPTRPSTYAFLTSEGEWHEQGKMGWFGMSTGDKPAAEWDAEYLRLVEAEADNTWFVLVDAHI